MKNPVYSVEFKVKAVELLESSDKSQHLVARDLGIGDSTLSKWARQYKSGMFHKEPKLTASPLSSSEKEIARLQLELKRKQMEIEILKKATAFFAKESY